LIQFQAIALSLGESTENENGGSVVQNKADQIRKCNKTTKKPSLLKKTNKKPVCLLFIFLSVYLIFSFSPCLMVLPFFFLSQSKSRIQLSEDEVIGFFFSFDGNSTSSILLFSVKMICK
jgi:hypothetical protein